MAMVARTVLVMVFSSVLSSILTGLGPEPGGTFFDDDGNVHEGAIEAIAAAGLTVGCGSDPPRFCPDGVVVRAEMAVFLHRALGHPVHGAASSFDDVPEGAWFAPSVRHLQVHRITRGCSPRRYCPSGVVTRAQMASFLVRALDVSPASGDRFADDDASIHEGDIDALAAAGITSGCAADRFCPDQPVRRDEMASFLTRALGLTPRVPPHRFDSSVSTIGAELAGRMATSWRPGCPVPLSDLRYLRLDHWGFDGREHQGELVVHADHANDVVAVFEELFRARFPIRRMRLVDDYGGDDDASMAANNSSAFNCRRAQGSSSWSEHAFGRAIDLNPVENPYVRGTTVLPPAGEPFVDRTRDEPGMVHPGGPVTRAFAAVGWEWGGDWRTLKDWQHFSATGR